MPRNKRINKAARSRGQVARRGWRVSLATHLSERVRSRYFPPPRSMSMTSQNLCHGDFLTLIPSYRFVFRQECVKDGGRGTVRRRRRSGGGVKSDLEFAGTAIGQRRAQASWLVVSARARADEVWKLSVVCNHLVPAASTCGRFRLL